MPESLGCLIPLMFGAEWRGCSHWIASPVNKMSMLRATMGDNVWGFPRKVRASGLAFGWCKLVGTEGL